MIEIEKTYKITFTEEQLQELFNLLVRNADDLRGTALNPIYHDLKDTFNPATF